ncbi:MAG TPA: M23 family metallopeptidase [Candidatus Acidoferrales bacterium]|jgi:murein DD-endopeptidase MepM/ murein hydrolase activator NlpD|nr:M23 family metallopeptidase [Candidatus Acidoferrales bacterium]
MNLKVRIVIYGVIFIAGAVALANVLRERYQADAAYAREVQVAIDHGEKIAATAVLFSGERVAQGATLADSLRRMGLDPIAAGGVAGSAQTVFNLRRFHAGNFLWVGRSVEGSLRAVRYQIDPDQMLCVEWRDIKFEARIEAIPSHTEVMAVTGKIENSLFNAVTDAGESPELAIRMAEIFGWDLDFYTDPRVGDTFRILVEKKTYTNGQTAGYGKILAAEYVNARHPYQAVLFHDAGGAPAYYKPDGGALQKAFLKSPLKFAAPVTSHFSMSRFHPILKTFRPHLGVDYGAPIGTPVQTIGNGRVIFAAMSGGSGNLVRIQHSNGYETQYMHLSRILVRVGEHVEAGQRIGLVGKTGLATGPHLDFRILENGKYLNFETLHLPPAEPVARQDMTAFAAARDRWMPMLGSGVSLAARVH